MATPVVDAPLIGSKFDENVVIPANNAADTVQKLYNTYHGYREILISTAGTAEMSVALAPRCVAAYFLSGSTYTDLLGGDNGLIDRGTAGTSGGTLDAMSGVSKLLFASHRPFRGVWFEIESANSNSSAFAVRYSAASGWSAAAGENDGTDSAGATLAVDGNFTWTLPSDWEAVPLAELQGSLAVPWSKVPLYWVEFDPTNTLSADVSIDALGLLSSVAPDVGGINLKVSTEYTFDIDDDVGGLEMSATSTTATEADITWLKR